MNYLIVQPFGIGDSLFVSPILRHLKKIDPGCRVDLLLGSRSGDVFVGNPYVDQIFVLDKDALRAMPAGKRRMHYLESWMQMRKRHYDVLLDVSMSREYAFWSWALLGVPVRVGLDYRKRGTFYNRKLDLSDGFVGKHVAAFYAELLELIGTRMPPSPPEIYFRIGEEAEAEQKLQAMGLGPKQEYLVIAPGGGASWGPNANFKQWPTDYFAQAAHEIFKKKQFSQVVIAGGKDDEAVANDLLNRLREPSLNLTGQLSLRESAILLKHAGYFLSNDSGLVHLARAVNTPMAAIYGPVDEAVYGPYPADEKFRTLARKDLECQPCYKKFRFNAACEDKACLQEFKPEGLF